MRPVRAAGIIKDRMTVIGPLVTGKSTLDLGVVDSRRQRHQTDQRLEKTPSSLFRQIHKINPEAMGVDIDAEGVDLLSAQGFNTRAADVMDMNLGDSFQAIIAGEIIEHLTNPGQFLINMRKHLTSDGNLVITTPNPFYVKHVWKILRYQQPSVHEEHTCWFDPITLSQLCRMCDLEPYAFYWIQPRSQLLKTWPRLFRNYFCHSFMLLARPQ